MQSIISANQKSKTEASATKDAMIPYYSASKALPELGIQFQKVSPYISFSGPIAGNSLTFKLPAGSGFLYDSSLGFSCTTAGALNGSTDSTAYVGLRMIRQLDWMSNGQPVLTQTGAAIRALVKTLPADQQAYIYRYSLPLVSGSEAVVGAASAFVTYTPLIASWLTSVEKCLLLSQIGDLQLRVTFETQAITGISQAISLAAGGATLYCQTYMPKLSVYNQMVLNDWSKTLIMECFNTYTEVVPMTTATTVSNYTITCPFLVYRTHLFVENIVVTRASFAIESITMNVGGVPLLDAYPRSRTLGLKAKSGLGTVEVTSDTALSFDDKDHLIIDWGVHSTRDKNTGTAFLQELRGAVVSIVCATVTTAANANLYIIHEYWNEVAYQPAASGNGILQVYQNA